MALTLNQQIALITNATLRQKVQQAVIVAAHAILGDPGQAAQHATRLAHVKFPDFYAKCMTPGVVAILSTDTPTDAEIQTAVNSIADRYRP